MTQTQLFPDSAPAPGTVHLTAFLVDQMHAARETLVRLQRDGKRQHPGRGAIQLHLRGVEERQPLPWLFRQRRQLGAVRFCRRAWVLSAAGAGAEACGVPAVITTRLMKMR